MRLRIRPQIGGRYWAAILLASVCGTNLGDFFLDFCKVPTIGALIIVVVAFSLLIFMERLTARGHEVFYWLCILVVRSAATNIADLTIHKGNDSYLGVGLTCAVVLTALVVAQRRRRPEPQTALCPPTNGLYWLTMLTAGVLGTIVGDGAGHAFGAVQIGVPVSAGLATLALVVVLGSRLAGWTSATNYWVSVVAVRWWGTNVGDILAFLLGLSASLLLSGLSLAIMLRFWPKARSDRHISGSEAVPFSRR